MRYSGQGQMLEPGVHLEDVWAGPLRLGEQMVPTLKEIEGLNLISLIVFDREINLLKKFSPAKQYFKTYL